MSKYVKATEAADYSKAVLIMAEYINREALTIENLEKYMTVMEVNTKEYGQQVVVAVDDLMYLPTADVAEVRHGKWQTCFEDWRKQIEGDECSACGFQHYGTNIRNYLYCPNCGARMDGETK